MGNLRLLSNRGIEHAVSNVGRARWHAGHASAKGNTKLIWINDDYAVEARNRVRSETKRLRNRSLAVGAAGGLTAGAAAGGAGYAMSQKRKMSKADFGRESSRYVQGKQERRAVSRAVMRDKDYWKYGAGAAAGYAAGGAGAMYLARRGKPKAALAALGAGAIAGLPLDMAAGRTSRKSSNRARLDMGLPERTFWTGRQKTSKSLSGIAKAWKGEPGDKRNTKYAAAALGGSVVLPGLGTIVAPGAYAVYRAQPGAQQKREASMRRAKAERARKEREKSKKR